MPSGLPACRMGFAAAAAHAAGGREPLDSVPRTSCARRSGAMSLVGAICGIPLRSAFGQPGPAGTAVPLTGSVTQHLRQISRSCASILVPHDHRHIWCLTITGISGQKRRPGIPMCRDDSADQPVRLLMNGLPTR